MFCLFLFGNKKWQPENNVENLEISDKTILNRLNSICDTHLKIINFDLFKKFNFKMKVIKAGSWVLPVKGLVVLLGTTLMLISNSVDFSYGNKNYFDFKEGGICSLKSNFKIFCCSLWQVCIELNSFGVKINYSEISISLNLCFIDNLGLQLPWKPTNLR